MKVIVQIPCYNESDTLSETIADLPRSIPCVDVLEYLVIDDGSTDNTAELAHRLGVHHVLRLGSNRGLATAFTQGVEYALRHGADIVVNTDGDNQYKGQDIPALIQPVLQNQADMVVGCRPIIDHPEFGWVKKALQLAGSRALRWISKTTIRDAASGFRAFSRETCQRLFIHSRFSYCMETLIQAGNSGLRVASVDIGINPKTRESRLFSSVFEYVYKSGATILSMFVLYRPGRFFTLVGTAFEAVALALGVRFIYLVYITTRTPGRTYTPSLILLAMCALTGVLLIFLGILGEIVRTQRRVTEETLFVLRRTQLADGKKG
jgi:glycosyltransferase involved in cell wall biosynthesis